MCGDQPAVKAWGILGAEGGGGSMSASGGDEGAGRTTEQCSRGLQNPDSPLCRSAALSRHLVVRHWNFTAFCNTVFGEQSQN
ncbi:hypothetical protein COCON_G00225490 [Conger conger]|uniref:Uncharacterized protein n=1 Tax=Conger conger TaxID=82655 RepID=A0A9Q1CXE1_CONCO|nr:hypothetical protein COCON_G00225490 [Conger conger]